MKQIQPKHLESFRKTTKNVENLMNVLGFKVKNEITKTSFLITPWLQKQIKACHVVKDSNPFTHTAVAFHMANGKINTYPLHCGTKNPEMLQVMARKNVEITNLNHLTCHQEGKNIYYSFNQ